MVGVLNPPTAFSIPLTYCQIMFWGSAIYYIRPTYNFGQNFGRTPTIEKFNPSTIILQFKHCNSVSNIHLYLLIYYLDRLIKTLTENTILGF